MDKEHLVLIIEDDPDLSSMLRMVVELIPGARAEGIAAGEPLLPRLDRPPLPSLVILEPLIPEGEEFLHQVQARLDWKDVPLYLLTRDRRLARGYQQDPQGAGGVFWTGECSIDLLRELIESRVRS